MPLSEAYDYTSLVMTKNMHTKMQRRELKLLLKKLLDGLHKLWLIIKLKYKDEYLRNILSTTKTIAMVGLSPEENRPSNFAAKYLQTKGYKIIPINPITNRKYILKEKVYSSLHNLNFKPDMIDIFVKSKKILPIINDAISVKPKTIWLQIGVINKTAETKGKNANINL